MSKTSILRHSDTEFSLVLWRDSEIVKFSMPTEFSNLLNSFFVLSKRVPLNSYVEYEMEVSSTNKFPLVLTPVAFDGDPAFIHKDGKGGVPDRLIEYLSQYDSMVVSSDNRDTVTEAKAAQTTDDSLSMPIEFQRVICVATTPTDRDVEIDDARMPINTEITAQQWQSMDLRYKNQLDNIHAIYLNHCHTRNRIQLLETQMAQLVPRLSNNVRRAHDMLTLSADNERLGRKVGSMADAIATLRATTNKISKWALEGEYIPEPGA